MIPALLLALVLPPGLPAASGLVETRAAALGYPVGRIEAVRVAYALLDASRRESIPPDVLFAVAEQESNYQRAAVSRTGCCVGLLQLARRTSRAGCRELGIWRCDRRDPRTNARLGAHLLAALRRKHPGWAAALGCYALGERGWLRAGRPRLYRDRVEHRRLAIRELLTPGLPLI